MKIVRWTVAGCLMLAGGAWASTGSAQEAAPPPPGEAAELVFDREIFLYPRYNRRNPFSPLVNLADSGPRFEEMSLLGIVFSEDPQLSVVLFNGAALTTAEGGAFQQTYRLRRGEVIGNVRVIEIQPTRVIVDVDEFGVIEQRVLELQRGSGGNSP